MKALLKKCGPLHFAARIPTYWRRFNSERRKWVKNLPRDSICVTDEIVLRLPDHAEAYYAFEIHAFERHLFREIDEFLDLSKGCSSFIDLGASGGLFSALFVASRAAPVNVLSVEPDRFSLRALRSTCEKNSRDAAIWQIAEVGVGASSESITAYTDQAGFGISVMKNAGPVAVKMQIATLDELCSRHNIEPDLVKFDIETMEYEVIESSLDLLRKYRPRIHLELHSPLLSARDRDPRRILAWLSELGYRQYSFTSGGPEEPPILSEPGCITHFNLICR